MTNPYPTRSHTYVAGDQVNSSDLNAIQDGVIAVGAAVAVLEADMATAQADINGLESDVADLQIERSETASINRDELVVDPDRYGGKTVWFEAKTDGTGVVEIDDSIDWRDRWVFVRGYLNETNIRPGQANDDSINVVLANGSSAVTTGAVHLFCYTQAGNNGGTAKPGIDFCPDLGWTEHIRIFARNTDGVLCMRKDAHSADPDAWFFGEATCSPSQNHY